MLIPAGAVAAIVEQQGQELISPSSRFWPARRISGDGDGGTQVGPFLAFGGTRFVCSASAAFGFMMAALLVGTLVEALEQPGVWVVEDAYTGEMMRAAQPLSSKREAYGDLRIMRKRVLWIPVEGGSVFLSFFFFVKICFEGDWE